MRQTYRMTELLFHTDAFLQAFEANVVAVDGERVALDRTALYARSGGQPSDVGILRASVAATISAQISLRSSSVGWSSVSPLKTKVADL